MTPRFAQYYLPRFFVDHGHYSDNLAPDRGPQRRRSTRTVSSGVLFCRNALGFGVRRPDKIDSNLSVSGGD